MTDGTKAQSSVDLQSLVESHEKPFVVIDRDYRILAVNRAYERVYGTATEWAVGKSCFNVSHGNNLPCNQTGEDCPHTHVFATGEPHSCLHIHYDADHHMHQVRVTAYPLRCPDGTLCMGETVEELSAKQDKDNSPDQMVGRSKPFLACMEHLKMAAGSDATVLLQGETGTGKELGAKFIHDHSARKSAPFMVIDCTVLTESLFEAEVFGHVHGAYTGSVGERAGLFEQAEGGTLCLDEIGELPRSLQAKLLRVLETGQYRRVGGHKTLRSDVRIICATNRHLWESVLAGQFREDLYYRIACLNIRIPSLRERLDDIPLLAENLLRRMSRSMQRGFHLTPEAVQRLREYQYPGNVRELRNILHVAATHCSDTAIDDELIRNVMTGLSRARARTTDGFREAGQVSDREEGNAAWVDREIPVIPEDHSLDAIEAQHIRELLNTVGNTRRQVAEVLGVSERTLYRKMKKYNLAG